MTMIFDYHRLLPEYKRKSYDDVSSNNNNSNNNKPAS